MAVAGVWPGWLTWPPAMNTVPPRATAADPVTACGRCPTTDAWPCTGPAWRWPGLDCAEPGCAELDCAGPGAAVPGGAALGTVTRWMSLTGPLAACPPNTQIWSPTAATAGSRTGTGSRATVRKWRPSVLASTSAAGPAAVPPPSRYTVPPMVTAASPDRAAGSRPATVATPPRVPIRCTMVGPVAGWPVVSRLAVGRVAGWPVV